MGYLVFILLFFGVAFAVSLMAKAFLWIIGYKPKSKNPYIAYHQLKDRNDENYDEYLEWLKRNGRGAPIEKVKSPEDVEAEKKLRKLF